MDAPSDPDIDGAATEAEFSSPSQHYAVGAGAAAALLTVLFSAFFVFWMAVLAQTYVDEIGGWCGTVIFAIQGQLMMLAPWCLLVIYMTSSVSSRFNVAPTLTRRCFQAAVTSWISLFLGMLISGH
jgi:hypothetical protein